MILSILLILPTFPFTRVLVLIDKSLLLTYTFRVFYDIEVDRATVVIAAVGRKVHNRLFIGGEEIEL